MFVHQTVPFPELTGDAELDIKNLHEYTFKLQESLIYTMSNLALNNFSKDAFDGPEIKRIIDSKTEQSGDDEWNYIKFSDGTLIQQGIKHLDSVSLTQIATSGVYFQAVDFYPPVSFAKGTKWRVWGNSKYSTGHCVPFSSIFADGSAMYIHIYDFFPRNGNEMVLHWTAIGRWK